MHQLHPSPELLHRLKGTTAIITGSGRGIALRLSMYYMQRNKITDHGHRGSAVLVTSTSGYFGLTGNLAYIASKHGSVGLLRACQPKAEAHQIRVNSIAPSFTPTHITAGFGDSLQNAGVESNTPEMVATAIAYAALDESQQGSACLVAGKFLRELEHTRKTLMPEWLGTDVLEMMACMGGVMKDLGGFPLPQASPMLP